MQGTLALQAGGLFGVGDDLGVDSAGARGVEDADGFIVAAQQPGAVMAERHTVGRRHLINCIVGPVRRAQLAANCIPKVQRVRLAEAQCAHNQQKMISL